MRQRKYTDGTPSREMEDEDWETSGQEEMDTLWKKHTQEEKDAVFPTLKPASKTHILDVRSRLDNICDLIALCVDSLNNSQLYEVKSHVANVLYFQVKEQLEIADKELANL